MMTDKSSGFIVKEIDFNMNKLKHDLDYYLIGRKIIIRSNYNDQSVGRSKKSLTGTVQTISSVGWEQALGDKSGIHLYMQGLRHAIPIYDVEFID